MDENNKDKIPKLTITGNTGRFKSNAENKSNIPKESFPNKNTTKKLVSKKFVIPDNSIQIPVFKNSKVILDNSIPIDNNIKLQLLRVLEIDKEYPSGILGFNPPLYKEFITKAGDINTHVKINQEVKLKLKFKKEINEKRIVKDLYFTSLNDITVIIAKLDNNDYYPSYQLESYEY